MRSPRLVLPGCIGLKPTSTLRGRRGLKQAVVRPELLAREPVQVLLDRRAERPGVGLRRRGPGEDHAARGVADLDLPPQLAPKDVDRVVVHLVAAGRRSSSRSSCSDRGPNTDVRSRVKPLRIPAISSSADSRTVPAFWAVSSASTSTPV